MNNRIFKSIIAVIVMLVVVFTNTNVANAKTADAASSDITAVAGQPATKKTSNKTQKNTFKKYPMYIGIAKSKIYTKDSKKSKVVKTYYKGSKVNVLEKSGDFRRIGKNLWVHKNDLRSKNPMKTYKGIRLLYHAKYNITKNKLTRSKGVVHYNGHKETWYSSKEYGQTRTAYSIPGKHIAKDGTYRDKDGYICIAANYLQRGAVIKTSLGPGKVYDRGGMRGQWIDIYTNW